MLLFKKKECAFKNMKETMQFHLKISAYWRYIYFLLKRAMGNRTRNIHLLLVFGGFYWMTIPRLSAQCRPLPRISHLLGKCWMCHNIIQWPSGWHKIGHGTGIKGGRREVCCGVTSLWDFYLYYVFVLFFFTFSCSSMVHEFITANKKYFFSGKTSLAFIQTSCFWVLRLFKPRTVNA